MITALSSVVCTAAYAYTIFRESVYDHEFVIVFYIIYDHDTM